MVPLTVTLTPASDVGMAPPSSARLKSSRKLPVSSARLPGATGAESRAAFTAPTASMAGTVGVAAASERGRAMA